MVTYGQLMTTNAEKAFQCETEFLSGVEANFEAAKGTQFRGSTWKLVRDDEGGRLRALLASHRMYDRQKLRSLPANRRIALHGFDRRLLFGKRPTGVAVASVLSPLDHYVSTETADPSPIGLGELVDHVRQLTGEPRIPYLVGICSPAGFTEEAKNAQLHRPNVTVVLVEPDAYGGWHAMAAGEGADPRVVELFDPENAQGKVDRVRAVVEEQSAALLTGGLSASSIARKMNLPAEVVRQGFAQVAADDPELRVSKQAGEMLLFRGAPVSSQEKSSMNVIDRIRRLFSGEGSEAEKINLLSERRASMAQRRDRMYEDIAKLEKKEAELLAQGKAAASPVPKRRIAAQLAQLRKDITRQNTTAAMLNQQIDVISTDIHHLTLIQQGQLATLPDAAELTENAVRAEEMLETINADVALVGSLNTGVEESLTSEEELAILKEFEASSEIPTSTQTDQVAKAPPLSPPTETPRSAEAGTSEPAPEPDTESRRPDAEPM